MVNNIFYSLVLQKALACAREPFYSVYITAICPLLENLRTLNFGSKLYVKLKQTYPELNAYEPFQNTQKIQRDNKRGRNVPQSGNFMGNNMMQGNIQGNNQGNMQGMQSINSTSNMGGMNFDQYNNANSMRNYASTHYPKHYQQH